MCNYKGLVEGDVYRRCGERGCLVCNGWRRCGGVEIADGCRAQCDGYAGISTDRHIIHIQQGLEPVVAREIDGGRAADERRGVSAAVSQFDALDLRRKRGHAGQGRVSADHEYWTGCARGCGV